MKTAALLLTALLWAPASAHQDEADRTIGRFSGPLAQPESFGRQADNSRLYPDAATVPASAAGSPGRQRTPESVLTRPTPQPASRAREIPSPSAPSAPRAYRLPRAAPLVAPFAIGAVLSAGAALLLTGYRREPPAYRITFPTTTPLPPLKSPPKALPRLAPPPFERQPALPESNSAPEDRVRAPRWWAISREEQSAMDRWAAGVAAGGEPLPLEKWLDAHEGELSGMNIPRLKEKLWRDA